MTTKRPRRGISPPEVIVVLVILFVVLMAVLLALPRQRENARLAGCRRNLMQIGIALALYDRSEGSLPTIPPLTANPQPTGGPLKAILDALVLPDLTELADASKPPPPRPGQVPGERFVAGFVCPSDGSSSFLAPISYRATTGDQPGGINGGFAPGRMLKLADIEEGDGLSYTSAFSERRHGLRDEFEKSFDKYMTVPGPLVGAGCPASDAARWHGDAGASWAEASWRSTLYNHALTPNASPSCTAADGRTAFMGASSVHGAGVNVLIFDGSVRTVGPTIAPPIWKALATTRARRSRALR